MGAPSTRIPADLLERGHAVVEEQEAIARRLEGDRKGWFAVAYAAVTRHELGHIFGGRYAHPAMKLREVVCFHHAWAANLAAWERGDTGAVEPHWQVALSRAESAGREQALCRVMPSVCVREALLPSVEAHVRLDLPRAVVQAHRSLRQAEGGGLPLRAFREDFFRMQGVFALATADIGASIARRGRPWDPGSWRWVQRRRFDADFDLPAERRLVWEKAVLVADALRRGLGVHEADACLRRALPARHPGLAPFAVAGWELPVLDWYRRFCDEPCPGPG